MDNFRSIAKQIRELDMFDEVLLIAGVITEKQPGLDTLSDEQIKTLMWINTILPESEDKENQGHIIAEAMLLGEENIKSVINEISTLLRIEVEKIYVKIQKEPAILLLASSHVKQVYNYLQSIGLDSGQIREVFFEAVQLDEKSLKDRCDIILKHWSIDDLMFLAKCHFFGNIRYYDVIEAVTTAINELGTRKAMEFFRSYVPFFVEYRSEDYRKMSCDISSHEAALKAIEDYKNK